jgi:hypothetical protein
MHKSLLHPSSTSIYEPTSKIIGGEVRENSLDGAEAKSFPLSDFATTDNQKVKTISHLRKRKTEEALPKYKRIHEQTKQNRGRDFGTLVRPGRDRDGRVVPLVRQSLGRVFSLGHLNRGHNLTAKRKIIK